jgi:hypothetical protein
LAKLNEEKISFSIKKNLLTPVIFITIEALVEGPVMTNDLCKMAALQVYLSDNAT